MQPGHYAGVNSSQLISTPEALRLQGIDAKE